MRGGQIIEWDRDTDGVLRDLNRVFSVERRDFRKCGFASNLEIDHIILISKEGKSARDSL